MNVKIEAATRELRPLKGARPGSQLYTGLKIGGSWYNLAGDHRNLYNKVVDLELDGNMASFASPQTPPALHQAPPPPPPPAAMNGHTPRWPNREAAVDAYVFYATQVSKYISDPYAIAKAANCLISIESNGEINPVHREGVAEPFRGAA
jgi:hypothetical protein